MRLLKYGSKIMGEKRKADFLAFFGRAIEVTRIISFGSCNFHCPYCKRDGQQVDNKGNIIRSVDVDEEEVYKVIKASIDAGERIRLSGGDPCMHMKDSMRIASYAESLGVKISMAHNGSSLRFSEMMLPYMDYVAIDLKASNPEEMSLRAGIPLSVATKALETTLQVQDMFSNNGVLVDIRTPVFSTTTLDDLCRMAEMILKGGDNSKEFWTLRKYNPVRHCDWKPVRDETLTEMAMYLSDRFPGLPIGVKEKWSGGGFKVYHK